MAKAKGLFLWIGALLATAAPAGAQEYDERAELWLERNGLAEDPPATVEESLLRGFARVRIGLFQVYVAAGPLEDDEWVDLLRGSVQALLDLQLEWVSWLPGDGGTDPPAALEGHARTLTRWIKGWKHKSFDDAARLRGQDFLEITSAKDKVSEASTFLVDYLSAGGPLVVREEALDPAVLVLLPERADFVEYSALVGRLDEELRPLLWLAGAATWTYFDFRGSVAVALQFATPEGNRDYTRSIAMTYKNKHAISEHATQLGMRAMLERLYGDHMEPMVAAGLANNMVIALFQEVDTRTDGDTRSRSKAAVSAFIPGAASGGTLPAQNADSRWRETKGEDYFVGVLRKAQKAGAKRAEESWQKKAGFVLENDAQSNSHLVLAPVLGPSGQAPPPEEFTGDHAEFLRAYRSAFLHWLQEKAAGRGSHASFAHLLRAIAEDGSDLAACFQTVYERPLSAPGEELPDSLEGDFLAWLTKQ